MGNRKKYIITCLVLGCLLLLFARGCLGVTTSIMSTEFERARMGLVDPPPWHSYLGWPLIFMLGGLALSFLGHSEWADQKGRHRAWGFLGLATPISMLVLALLKPKPKPILPDLPPCPYCGSKEFKVIELVTASLTEEQLAKLKAGRLVFYECQKCHGTLQWKDEKGDEGEVG
ncbi:MAG: hypothetical protein ISS54_07370 [Dehalococcoidia bacterium]|nr:hypothetical protein [Dehalococcoidia bacterium]